MLIKEGGYLTAVGLSEDVSLMAFEDEQNSVDRLGD